MRIAPGAVRRSVARSGGPYRIVATRHIMAEEELRAHGIPGHTGHPTIMYDKWGTPMSIIYHLPPPIERTGHSGRKVTDVGECADRTAKRSKPSTGPISAHEDQAQMTTLGAAWSDDEDFSDLPGYRPFDLIAEAPPSDDTPPKDRLWQLTATS